MGWSARAPILTTRPFSMVAVMAQVSGQSCGQMTVRTSLWGAGAWTGAALDGGVMGITPVAEHRTRLPVIIPRAADRQSPNVASNDLLGDTHAKAQRVRR